MIAGLLVLTEMSTHLLHLNIKVEPATFQISTCRKVHKKSSFQEEFQLKVLKLSILVDPLKFCL